MAALMRDTVPLPTPTAFATFLIPSPAASRARTAASTFGPVLGRPRRTPRALARSRPAMTRLRIMPRSNSANAPVTWKNMRPAGSWCRSSAGAGPVPRQLHPIHSACPADRSTSDLGDPEPRQPHVEAPARRILQHRIQARPLVAPLRTGHAIVRIELHNLPATLLTHHLQGQLLVIDGLPSGVIGTMQIRDLEGSNSMGFSGPPDRRYEHTTFPKRQQRRYACNGTIVGGGFSIMLASRLGLPNRLIIVFNRRLHRNGARCDRSLQLAV
jgi:hypothetical protein